MGFDQDRIDDVRAAALLHDVGKLETSRELLYKAASLTPEEMAEMRKHVQKGSLCWNPSEDLCAECFPSFWLITISMTVGI